MPMTSARTRIMGVHASNIQALAEEISKVTAQMHEEVTTEKFGKSWPGQAISVEVIPFPINPGTSRSFHALVMVGIPGEVPVEVSGSIHTESGI